MGHVINYLLTGCSCRTIFLLTGLRIYTGEYKAQGPTLCPTEGSAHFVMTNSINPLTAKKWFSKESKNIYCEKWLAVETNLLFINPEKRMSKNVYVKESEGNESQDTQFEYEKYGGILALVAP